MPYRRGKQPSVAFPVFVSGVKIVEHQIGGLDRIHRLTRKKFDHILYQTKTSNHGT